METATASEQISIPAVEMPSDFKRCDACLGHGYIEVLDSWGEDTEMIECGKCECSGLIEIYPF